MSHYRDKYTDLIHHIKETYKQTRERNAEYIFEREVDNIKDAFDIIDNVKIEKYSPDTAFEVGEVRSLEMLINFINNN